MPTIKLQSSDDVIFDVDVQIVKCSGTIRYLLENCCLVDDPDVVFPLPEVNSKILSKILIWANYHKDNPKPTTEDEDSEKFRSLSIAQWDADFLKVDQDTLLGLFSVANDLDIKELINLTCEMLKSRTPEEMRNMVFDLSDKYY